MKDILLLVLAFLVFTAARSQTDTCVSDKRIVARAYINGERDTTDRSGPQKVIKRSLIANGMHLSLTDTTYKIISYRITFVADSSLAIVTVSNKGEELQLSPKYDIYLKKMKAPNLFTLEQIRVSKANQCYFIRSLIYYID
jgi:hypothetical protein